MNTVETVIGGRVLIVDDDPEILRVCANMIEKAGHRPELAATGQAAIDFFRANGCDVILSDVSMPGMDGVQLLREVRRYDLDVPVILMTASLSMDAATKALELGAFRYLAKPFTYADLRLALAKAIALVRTTRLKREVLNQSGTMGLRAGDRAGLTVMFESAVRQIWMAYQPIVRWSTRSVFACEALVRSRESALGMPEALFEAARRLGQAQSLSRSIRSIAPAPMSSASGLLFVNLCTADLMDEELFQPSSPLAALAERTVLEVTERASLDEVSDVRDRVAALRRMGFRIALDDMGAGYSGLNSFAALEPDVAKIDMSLVKEIQSSPTRQRLIESITSLCESLDTIVVAEGVETLPELRVLIDLGCDYFQGFLFARPGPPFPTIAWSSVSETFTSPGILRAGAS